jgi:hypothetical protein
MTYHNVYEHAGQQWSGCDCVSCAEADTVAEIVGRSGIIRRVAVIRVHPKMMLEATVTKL